MNKAAVYEECLQEIESVLEGEADQIARMSTVCAVLKRRLPWISWVGFYRSVSPGMLVVGPYQGDIGCLRIPHDRGVCGAAARSGESQIVPDVHAFPGHIACDSLARSEIVVPVRDSLGAVRAVLDLDSHLPAAFDSVDREFLERLVARLVEPAS